ncbi:MAG: DUF4270 domain-containing protein [Prevotellaceae bacterium]|jgi:hypothetical protein|nr:DUF4270 domain-containing protein [Prevotellaceae bacterium]
MKRFFFSLLVIAITGFSCVNVDNSFGTDFIPEDQQPGLRVRNIPNLPVYTATVDSIVTNSGYVYTGLFGSINVTPFHTMNADLVFRIYPYVSGHNFGENPEFVAASLLLIISGRNVVDEGQQNIVQNVHLYELNRTLYYDSTYYNTSITEKDCKQEPINMPGLTYNGGDTLLIPLTEAFGKELLSGTANDMDSLVHFYERYKGFVLTVDPQAAGIQGGRLNTTDISSAYLTLQYKDNGKDTSMLYWGDYGLVFSAYRHSSDYLSNYQSPPAAVAQPVYFESLAGVKPAFDVAAIKDSLLMLVDSLKDKHANNNLKILLNKAELVISIDSVCLKKPEWDMDKCPPVLALCSRTVNDAGKLTYPMINDVSNAAFDGTLNRSLMSYSFNITHYLQQFLKPQPPETTTLYLFPTTTLQDDYGYSYTVLDNTNYTYVRFLDHNHASPATLKLIYTILY